MTAETDFLYTLKVASLLPKADVQLAKQHGLSRRQMYLLYLVWLDKNHAVSLAEHARNLNISNSTLTRNVEKLEARKLCERIKLEGSSKISLRLLSLGQLYAIEIGDYFAQHFARPEIKGELSELRNS